MLCKFKNQLEWITQQHQTMLDSVIELAQINSGSLNLSGLGRMRSSLSPMLSALGSQVEEIELPAMQVIDDKGNQSTQSLGHLLSAHKHPSAALQILLVGHMDTVYGIDHSFQDCQWLDDTTLNGPGVADLKAGLIIMLTALQALEQSPWAGQIGWRVLINPDEEIGSIGSAPLLDKFARQNQLGLIFEPSLPDGTLAGARKGSGNFTIVVRGKAAHAGREHHLGRNAIRHCCDLTSALDQLNGQRSGITINPGYIHGGGAVNIVPDLAVLKFNVRISRSDDEAWFMQKLDGLIKQINAQDGISAQLDGRFGRKPKLLEPDTLQLFELIKDTGAKLDTPISWKDTGGCCDGNNLAAAGLPNVDTLGAIGGAIHSSDEYIDVSSLTQRAKLTALLLMRLASGEISFNRTKT